MQSRVREQANAIITHWEFGNDLGDPGAILDHADSDIIGSKALNSPVIRNWVVKLVREHFIGQAFDKSEFDRKEEEHYKELQEAENAA